MKHANYKYLQDTGKLDLQYIPCDRVTEHLACGKFVAEMYKEVSGIEIPYIQNILAPKVKTEKILRLVTCSRIYDEAKGWNRMLKMCEMMKQAKIKFEWIIFSEFPEGVTQAPYPEMHVYKPTFNIFDYVVDADYVVLLSDSEGLPLQILEGLQYQTPAIVTDVGGCTELIKDGVNGYVVPLDMNFDINRIKKIPKLKPYQGTTADDWCDFLGDAEYKKKPLYEYGKVKIKAISSYYDTALDKQIEAGDTYEVDEERADQIIKADLARLEC